MVVKDRKHAILSEKLEDQVKAGEWGKIQEEHMRRNKQIGDESWKRILPTIIGAKMNGAKN